MRRVLASAFCAFFGPTAPALASPPTAYAAPAADTLDDAITAWRRGDWTGVRDLLEPLVRDGGTLGSSDDTETALRYLADATMLDRSLDESVRRGLATEYVERLLDRDLAWKPPADTHSEAFEGLIEEVRVARRQKEAENCSIERTTCQANLHELRVAHDELVAKHTRLEAQFARQEIEVRSLAAKNRAVALLPAGIGHFYNGRPGLGAGFLAAEVAFGATGLALLLTRTLRYNCVREAGFSRGSVVCTPPESMVDEFGAEGTRRRIENVRNAEQTFGILFIGTLVLDVVIAQVTFKPYTVVGSKTMTREQLEQEMQKGTPTAPKTPRKAKSRRGKKAPSAKIRPTVGPGGIGLDLRF